jgi:DNA-binding LacI/PurR family transcriptional regulator
MRVTRTRPRSPDRPTIAEIARAAGVSVPTVSKVINGRPDVAPETRRRVEAIIAEKGYRRSERASRHTALLEVIFHELESEWALEIVHGVEAAARQHHLAVVITESQGRRIPGRGWIEGILARRPVGLVVVFSGLSEGMQAQLKARGIPFAVVDPTGEPVHEMASVGATNWNGGLAATRHLLSLGHRRIGMITGPSEILCSRARLDGYRSAMDAAGVPVDPYLIRFGDFHVASGLRYAREMLRNPDPPTAIFAANDLMALGVYQAAREARLHIPEDLSVVGFDDLPVAKWVGPNLTTVRQPLAEMARTATELVIRMAAGEAPPQMRLELATELIVRESTAVPAAGRSAAPPEAATASA